MFPSVPRMEHDWYCEKDVRRYECSCGLWQLRQERGDFVQYDASMCRVTHPSKETGLPRAVGNVKEFLKLLVDKTASLNMAHFDREDE